MLLKYGKLRPPAGHTLDLYSVQLLNAAPFCKNYIKLYFEKRWNREEFLLPFFANIKRCHKFIEYVLKGAFPDKVTPDIDFIDEVVNQCYVPVVKIVL